DGCVVVAAITGDLVKQRGGRPSGYDGIRHRVGVTLVGIARLVDASLEMNAAALLNNVRRLVCRGVEVRCSTERHRVTASVGVGAELMRGGGRCRPLMGAHARYIVGAEADLDLRKMRQRRPIAPHSLGGDLGYRLVVEGRDRRSSFALHERAAGGPG